MPETQIPESELNKLLVFLKDYTKGYLEGDNRKPLSRIDCGIDDNSEELFCVVLTEKKEGDPQMGKDGNRDWNTYEDVTDFGRVLIREVADWKGTIIQVGLPLYQFKYIGE